MVQMVEDVLNYETFVKLYGTVCHGCKQRIRKGQIIFRADGNYYHDCCSAQFGNRMRIA